VNAERPPDEVLADMYPWCAHLEARLQALFADYVAAKQAHNVLISTICCSTGPR